MSSKTQQNQAEKSMWKIGKFPNTWNETFPNNLWVKEMKEYIELNENFKAYHVHKTVL